MKKLTTKPEEKGRSDKSKVMAKRYSLRKRIAGAGPGNRKRKYRTDVGDYFQVENSDDGEIKADFSLDFVSKDVLNADFNLVGLVSQEETYSPHVGGFVGF
ncbi:hypothetical protein R6Q59_024547 [Mikania micrantha]